MPVPGAASLAAFEAKLAETCAGPNVKDDAPRDAAKARRRAGLERLSRTTQEGHTILHHVVVNADEVAADALRRSLGAARWHALAEAPANDGRSARRLSRRLGRKRMQDVFDRYEAQYEAKVAKAKARAKEATRAAERDAARRATSARAAAREAESARPPETAAAAKEDVEVRLKALQKLEASIDASTTWDAEMVGKVDKALSAFGGGCLDPRVGAAVARIRASASAARRAAAIEAAAAAPAAAPARDESAAPAGALC